MALTRESRITLNDGAKIPVLGLGVWQAGAGTETRKAVSAALESGYRLIDTAKLYGNERDVGAAVRESGIPRDEIFVTTKLWNSDQGFESALRAFEGSRRELGLEYVDLYLVQASPSIAERILEGACEDPGARIGPVDRGQQLHDSASGGTPTCNTGPAIGEPGRVPSVPLSARTPRIWPEASHPAGGVQPAHEGTAPEAPPDQGNRREIWSDTRANPDPLGPSTWSRRNPEIRPPGANSRERGRVRIRDQVTGHGPPPRARRTIPLGMEPRRSPVSSIHSLVPEGGFYPRAGFPSVVRPRYELPGNLRPASLAERRRFYAETMDYRRATT